MWSLFKGLSPSAGPGHKGTCCNIIVYYYRVVLDNLIAGSTDIVTSKDKNGTCIKLPIMQSSQLAVQLESIFYQKNSVTKRKNKV